MGILAVTRAAERVTGVTTRAMRVAVSVDPLPFHAPGKNADPTPRWTGPSLNRGTAILEIPQQPLDVVELELRAEAFAEAPA